MQKRSNFKLLFLILIAVTIILRLIFVFGAKQVPVMWDARIYSSAAIGLLYYLDNTDSFGHPERLNDADSSFYQAQYEVCSRKYINGEQIDWLYYEVPNIPRAQEYLFISGPVYPIYLATLFAIVPSQDFTVVRVINILFDVLCLILVVQIVRRIWHEIAGLIAGAMYILYLPFTLYTGMISPDSLTMLFTLLAFYLSLKYYDKRESKYAYMVGAILALLILNRSTATLLFVPFIVGCLYDNRENLRATLIDTGKAAIPFVLILLPWLIVTFNHYGTVTLRDPKYSEANFRSSSSVEFEGYDLDYNKEDFWDRPVEEELLSDIPGYLGLLVKKFGRLWSKPYNDYDQAFILNKTAAQIFHLVIVLSGMFGVFLFLLKKNRGLIYLFLVPAYYTAIHIVFHSLARYNLNAMPFMIMASSILFYNLYLHFKTRPVKDLATASVVLIVGLILIVYYPIQWSVWLMGPAGGAITMFVKFVVLVFMLVFIFMRLYRHYDIKKSLKIAGAPSVILILLLLVTGGSVEARSEWKCHLDSIKQIAGNMIYIPKGFRVGPEDQVRVGIDLTSLKGMKNPTAIYLNGLKDYLYLNQPPYDYYYNRKMSYPVFDKIMDYGKERFRAWRFIPFSNDAFNQLLDKHGVIDIAIGLVDSVYEPGAYIDLYGSYYIKQSDSLRTPSVAFTSIEKFVETGEPRLYQKYKISSDSVISYYIDDVNKRIIDREDLSPEFGTQRGRYRIFIEVKRKDNSRFMF